MRMLSAAVALLFTACLAHASEVALPEEDSVSPSASLSDKQKLITKEIEAFAEISEILKKDSDKLPAATKNHYAEYIKGFKDLLVQVSSKKDLTLQDVESEIAKVHEKHNFFAAGGFY